ncbi:MAG: GNAT family N-acetyltransferase [Syntrophaceae bacterium]|nr:GNAT family N-acetyltransferase [Syntrophaceae bacterium]
MKKQAFSKQDIVIQDGYSPGLIGEITQAHAVYYSENWGFDVNFEAQVATELSEFCLRLNRETDGLWASYSEGNFVGSVAIDGSLREVQGARLRWFIVSPTFQGTGIGKMLFRKALDFCYEKQFQSVFLWTFKGLEAARSIYEKAGFVIKQDHPSSGWGGDIIEQKFVIDFRKLATFREASK